MDDNKNKCYHVDILLYIEHNMNATIAARHIPLMSNGTAKQYKPQPDIELM